MHNFVSSVFVLGVIWARGDHHKFMLKWTIAYLGYKMDAITNLMQNLEISKDYFLGKDLTTKKDFLQNVERTFKEQNFKQKIEFSYYIAKCCMCLSFPAEN